MTATPRKARPKCPHCDSTLKGLMIPDGGGWDPGLHWVCFNDDCAYYRDGWEWMRQNYEVKASYRYRIIDAPGAKASPIAVWSPAAMRDHIIANPEGYAEDTGADDGPPGPDQPHGAGHD